MPSGHSVAAICGAPNWMTLRIAHGATTNAAAASARPAGSSRLGDTDGQNGAADDCDRAGPLHERATGEAAPGLQQTRGAQLCDDANELRVGGLGQPVRVEVAPHLGGQASEGMCLVGGGVDDHDLRA